jgi:hypothetical protein
MASPREPKPMTTKEKANVQIDAISIATQKLILAELLKISDIIEKKAPLSDYSAEVQKRIQIAVKSAFKI